MNVLSLSLKNVLEKPLSSFLSWLLLTFGVTVVVLILLVSDQLKNEISKNANGIDLVVGAKGSPLQLILANIFHVDFPTGNIGLKEAASVSKSRYIDYAIPISLGDSYRGLRIVGTTPAYGTLYGAEMAAGHWCVNHMEVVIGAMVAQKLSLNVGDVFESQHGLSDAGESHGGHPFEVVGILLETNTVIDKLILTDISSIWEVHDHGEEAHDDEHSEEEHGDIEIKHLGLTVTDEQFEHEQITALLIKYRSPMGAVMLPRSINAESNLQAASPAFETARLFNIIGVGVQVLNILGAMIIVISAVSVFVALLNSLKDRKYDIAIMRSMGASKGKIFLNVFIEGLIITFVGAISGLIVAHLIVIILSGTLEGISPKGGYFIQKEWIVLAGCFVIGMLASLIPAIMAYKTDISQTLAKG